MARQKQKTASSVFDVDALRQLAGDVTFDRGTEYFRSGRVTLVSATPGSAFGHVSGTEDYQTEVTLRSGRIGGSCSCPAFNDHDYDCCKHMVAVALAANAAADGQTPDRLTELGDRLRRLDMAALVKLILGFAESSPANLESLEIRLAGVGTNDAVLARTLRKAIDRATEMTDYVEYRAVRDWAAGVRSALAAVAELAAEGGRPAVALELAAYAGGRIGQAIASIDDSDGHGGALLHRAAEIEFAAARQAPPEPVAYARTLFARDLAADIALFDEFADDYVDVLRDAGLAEYRRLATAAWTALPPPPKAGSIHWDTASGNRWFLRRVLDFFAERDGDVDARIALLAHDLSSPGRYLALAQFCLENGRPEEALRRAEEGLWIFEDGGPDERLLIFTTGLLAKARRTPEAAAMLWRAFEKGPELSLFREFAKLEGPGAVPRAAEVIGAGLQLREPARRSRDGAILVRILQEAGRFDEAWAVAEAATVPKEAKLSLAEASARSHPREAIAVFTDHIEARVLTGGNSGYESAARVVRELADLQSPDEHRAYVAALRKRFERKRNFIKLLDGGADAGRKGGR